MFPVSPCFSWLRAARPGTLNEDTEGFTLTEVLVAVSILTIIVGLAFSGWEGRTAQLRLRYATIQAASDLREARERAKEMRVPYRVTFVAASSDYTIAWSDDLVENFRLPDGVTASVNAVVTFFPLGPADSAHTITIHNSAGNGTIQVHHDGAIWYKTP